MEETGGLQHISAINIETSEVAEISAINTGTPEVAEISAISSTENATITIITPTEVAEPNAICSEERFAHNNISENNIIIDIRYYE